jgi:hypothetical protein
MLLALLSRLSIEVGVVLVEVDRCVGVSFGNWSITLERDLQSIATTPTVAPSRSCRLNIPAFALVTIILEFRHDWKRCPAKSHSTLTRMHPVPLWVVQLHAWLSKRSRRGQRRASGEVEEHGRSSFRRGCRAGATLFSLFHDGCPGFVGKIIPLVLRQPA